MVRYSLSEACPETSKMHIWVFDEHNFDTMEGDLIKL